MPTQLNRQILLTAIDGFEGQKRKLDEQIREVRALLSDGADGSTPKRSVAPGEPVTGRRRGRMSAAGRRAIAAAQRKRWAASKGETKTAAPKAAKKPKRKLSPAGRAAIVAALKKRWAAKRAAAK